MIDEMLEKYGLKYEELTPEEVGTLNTWSQALSSGQLTTDKIRENVSAMKETVENELVNTPEYIFFIFPNRKQVLLKARLKNLLMFENMLLTPEKMKRHVERSLAMMKKI